MASFEIAGSWLERRRKTKWLTQIHHEGLALGPPPTRIFTGRQSQILWNDRLTVISVVLGIAFLFPILVFGQIFFPGLLVFVWLYNEARPARLITYGNGVVNVISQTAMLGSPSVLVDTRHASEVDARRAAEVRFGDVFVSMKSGEHTQLVDAIRSAPAPEQPTTAAPPPPPLPNILGEQYMPPAA